MTKKEWMELYVGDYVYCISFKLDNSEGKPKLIPFVAKCEIVKFNFGRSQCRIKFENGQEIWKGRLKIEKNKFALQK
jgi:hypothetical protein